MTSRANPVDAFQGDSGGHVTPQGVLNYLLTLDLFEGACDVTVWQIAAEGQSPGQSLVNTFEWDKTTSLAGFFTLVEEEAGFGLPEEITAPLMSKMEDFREYVKDGTFLSLDISATNFDLSVTDSLFEEEEDAEAHESDGEDDTDFNTCDSCGGYNGNEMTGAIYPGNSKYPAHVFFEGLTSCDDVLAFVGSPSEVKEDVLDYLSYYRTRYSVVASFCNSLEWMS